MVCGAFLLVGSSVVASKVVTAAFPPFTATAVRFAIAVGLLIPWMVLSQGWPAWPGRRAVLALGLQALTGCVLFSVLLLEGLRRSGGVEAGLTLGTLPAVVALLAVPLLGERLDRRIGVAVLLAAGAGALLHGGKGAGGSGWLGPVLLFGAVVCEALFTLLGKRAVVHLSPVVTATAVSFASLALSLGPALTEQPLAALSSAPAAAWLGALWLGAPVTVGGFVLFHAGVAGTSGGAAGVASALVPLSAAGLSALLLGEALLPTDLMAGALVLGAILLLALPTGKAG
ncbi:hypothetical protein F11_09625 [Rhodospirillum rubrum F11]|nr:hypothetical protein F11_09625 [Rhodospirillum rubrum F11]